MDPQQLQTLLKALQGGGQPADDQSASLGTPWGGSQGLPTAQFSYGAPVPDAGAAQPDMYQAMMTPAPGAAPQAGGAPQWPYAVS